MRISAILSDYDGTLCPTGSLRTQNNTIPQELEHILWNISEKLPICIVSSKDFDFLHRRTTFADILSCILGIETLVLSRDRRGITTDNKCITEYSESNNLSCIKSSHLLLNNEGLHINSKVLASLSEDIELKFKEQVIVERKFTAASKDGGKILAGVTIDWRHLKEWGLFKKRTEPLLEEMINKHAEQRSTSTSSSTPHYPNLYIQTYSSHPFIDVYSTKCDKGLAFDNVISQIRYVGNNNEGNIMYLGDSENDNPAFRKATVSIGIKSDERLNPKLECEYLINYNELLPFLKVLQKNDFIFSKNLLE